MIFKVGARSDQDDAPSLAIWMTLQRRPRELAGWHCMWDRLTIRMTWQVRPSEGSSCTRRAGPSLLSAHTLLSKPFRSHTAEALMSACGGARRKRTSGPSQSGARKRHWWGLTPGSDEFARHKVSADVSPDRANDLAKRSGAKS